MNFLIIVAILLGANCMELRYSKRAEIGDQAASSSGYVYHSDSNGPVSYMQFNSDTGGAKYFPNHHQYYAKHFPINHAPLPYYHHPILKKQQQEEGKEYADESHSSEGEKGAKGYANNQNYEVGAKGEHEKEGQSGGYSESGGNKKGEHGEAENYASKHELAEGEEGGSSGESSSHKKGSKTTGFHKVYHKDEYKKDHTFYDESDSKGHYNKYGGGHKEHSSESGGHKKGGKSNASHHAGQFGKKGYYDKGHHQSDNSGYKGEEGDSKYYKNRADYSNDGGEQHAKGYGYEEKVDEDK